MGFARSLKERGIDFYRRIPAELTYGTNTGGFLSVCGAVTMVLLFVLEFNSFLTVTHRTTVMLDEYEDEQLLVHFNISLHAVPCAHAHVDVADTLGGHKLNMQRHVRKWKLLDAGQQGGGAGGGGGGYRMQELSPEKLEPREYENVDFEHTNKQLSSSLDRATFGGYIADHDVVLVQFYAPWCVWCQRLAPVWEKTAALLADEPFDVSVKLAKVDCTHPTERYLCFDHRVSAFPTILLFQGHRPRSHTAYRGHRTTEAMLAYVRGVVKMGHDSPADFFEEKLDHRRAAELEAAAGAAAKEAADAGRPLVEGCLITGHIMVHKVPGTLHITPHAPDASLSTHAVNVSHTVHHLAFGPKAGLERWRHVRSEMREAHVRQLQNSRKLDGLTFLSREANLTHEHYLKVVSSDVDLINGAHAQVYQYISASSSYNTEGERSHHTEAGDANPWQVEQIALAPGGHAGAKAHAGDAHEVPSVKFNYDLSPMHVSVEEIATPFYQFITSACAIIGGVFTVIGLADALLFRLAGLMTKKQD